MRKWDTMKQFKMALLPQTSMMISDIYLFIYRGLVLRRSYLFKLSDWFPGSGRGQQIVLLSDR